MRRVRSMRPCSGVGRNAPRLRTRLGRLGGDRLVLCVPFLLRAESQLVAFGAPCARDWRRSVALDAKACASARFAGARGGSKRAREGLRRRAFRRGNRAAGVDVARQLEPQLFLSLCPRIPADCTSADSTRSYPLLLVLFLSFTVPSCSQRG